MKIIFYLILIITCLSCNSEKKALNHLNKAYASNQETVIKYCRQIAPIKEFKKDSLIYIQGEKIVETDTLTLDCDTQKTVKFYNKIIKKTDTFLKTQTIVNIDETLLNTEKEKNYKLNIEKEKIDYKYKLWLKISLFSFLFIAIYIVLKIKKIIC